MGATHIITISEDSLRHYQGEKETLATEIGHKVLSLCNNWILPNKSRENLGDFTGAIAWRGNPDASKDGLFYWGADLKKLSDISEKELNLARRFVEKEIENRKLKK